MRVVAIALLVVAAAGSPAMAQAYGYGGYGYGSPGASPFVFYNEMYGGRGHIAANGRCNGLSYGTGGRSCGTATGGPSGGLAGRS